MGEIMIMRDVQVRRVQSANEIGTGVDQFVRWTSRDPLKHHDREEAMNR